MTLAIDLQPDSLKVVTDQSAKKTEIVNALVAYKNEAVQNRKSGMNPRDDKWRQNIDLYWNRVDFTGKADWQSKNVMPEVPSYVDRFAAALKEALGAGDFYTVVDPYDTEHDISQSIKNMTDVWLSTLGRSQVGTPLDFSSVFEEQMKLGALMTTSGVVLWKDDVPGGRVAFETVDPRFVWLDHTYRGLYRVRRTEVDMIDIARMAGMTSSKGKPLYDLAEVSRLVASFSGQHSEDAMLKSELSGQSEEVASDRKPVILDEYLASVMGHDGSMLMDKEVAIVANDQYLLRGPEKNPFTHGRDWLLYSPLMPVPLSPYGRSYMEDFGSVAKVFTDLTNLILDATYMASMKAYAMVPAMLKDPAQAASGIWPNKVFQLEEGYTADQFMKAIDLGSLDNGAIMVWDKIKGELSDAAGMNEIGLGQLPDKTHIAATAVQGAQQSASSMLRSVAQSVEMRFLDPLLDLVWKTGLQHAKPGDVRMANAVGADMYNALVARKNELIKRPITFQARGISALIKKQQKLNSVLNIMQIIGQNQELAAAFAQVVDYPKFLNLLFTLSDIDITKLTLTEREKMVQQVTAPMQEVAQQGSPPSANALNAMGGLATSMGVA